ncbi:MAG: MipA/OmpV family protein [Holophaga sp.]|jgi:outer membrane scaffolding protein for murein synthesis (MipA/OmpV family)
MRLRLMLLLLPLAPLAAQEPLPFLEHEPGPERGWALTLGARVLDHPDYLGSDVRRTNLLPVFDAEYNRTWYLGSSRVGPGFGGGAHVWREGGFTWDLGLGVGDSRPESRSPLLAGMGDQRADLFAGTGLHYHFQGFHAGLTLSHGLRDDAGDRVTLTLGQVVRVAPRWFLSAGVYGTWADTDAMNYEFGITPQQAANRAMLAALGEASLTPAQFGPFTAQAGVRDVGTRIALNYRPRPRWTWTVEIQGDELLGGVRNSPLVARNGSLAGGAGFAYRF